MIATPTDRNARMPSPPGGEAVDAEAARGRGEDVDTLARGCVLLKAQQSRERILLFDSWARLSRLLTTQRSRMLRHLHAHPEPSVSALASALDRPYGLVHEDLSVLEMAGLIERSAGEIRLRADKLSVVIDF